MAERPEKAEIILWFCWWVCLLNAAWVSPIEFFLILFWWLQGQNWAQEVEAGEHIQGDRWREQRRLCFLVCGTGHPYQNVSHRLLNLEMCWVLKNFLMERPYICAWPCRTTLHEANPDSNHCEATRHPMGHGTNFRLHLAEGFWSPLCQPGGKGPFPYSLSCRPLHYVH